KDRRIFECDAAALSCRGFYRPAAPGFWTQNVDIKNELIRQGEITDPASPKGRLLVVAAQLFRERGFERTTVRDLARASGLLSGSIFHHFRSKQEILSTMMRECIVLTLAEKKAALAAAPTPEARLRALIRCELQAINGDTGAAMSILVHEWRSLSEEGQQEILRLRDEYEGLWLAVLGEARELGLIDSDPFILRRLIVGALGWTINWFRPGRGLSLDGLTEEVTRLVLHRPPGATG